MLWIDKYQPRQFEHLLCHPSLSFILSRLIRHKQIPHLLLYGGAGGGKKTRIMALLSGLFGDSVYKVKAETITPEGVPGEFVCISSLYHTQITTSELGVKDRVCVQYMIKQLASQAPATSYASHDASLPKYRVFVIQEAELLTPEAQAGLRRTLEKYSKNARIILHCQQLSSIIAPLRSRFLCLRVPLPHKKEIMSVLESVRYKEGATWIKDDYLESIANRCERNLRRALLMLEVAVMQKCPPLDQLRLPWQILCEEVAKKATESTSMTGLLGAREVLYELLTSLIPADLILATICRFFVESTTSRELQYHISRAAAHYAFTLKLGNKEIWHLEAFVAQCINFIKKHKSVTERY